MNDDITEQRYLEMSLDCKQRIKIKNDKIKELSKLLFMSYTLVRLGLETDDDAFFEQMRSVLSTWMDDEIFDD